MIMIPKHIGIIPDGNRRFAKRLMKKPWKGHEWGISKIRKVFEWCKELDVKHVTFYALSLENLDKRPKKELNFLFRLATKEIKSVMKKNSFIHKNKVRVKFFGKLNLLPREMREKIKELTEATKSYSSYNLNFAIAYGGRQEIVDACKRIAFGVKSGNIEPDKIDEKVLRNNLYTNGMPDPDVIIRTSEQRLSGFLLWQSAYSEIVFLDTLWPELKKEEFLEAIKWFSEKERRFGK